MECPDCGEPVTDADHACPGCGKSLVGLNLNEQDSKEYVCRSCGEELEFISTYKQWYCYNCQEYMDLPEPTSNEIQSDLKEKSDVLKEGQNIFDNGLDSDAGLDPESTTDISWDEGDEGTEEWLGDDEEEDISDETSENAAYDTEDDEVFGVADSEEDSDEDFGETELSWDDGDESITEEEPEEGYDDADLFEESIHEEVEINGPAEDEEIEIDFESDDSPMTEELEIPETIELDENSGKDANVLNQLHQAWLKVNNILGLAPEDERVIELKKKLKNALEGKLEQNDAITLANSSLEEVTKLEKDLKEMIHHNISDLFHFVNSKLFLANKIGFTVDDLEEELDNISSLIARSEYHQAYSDLKAILERVFELPKTQDEIMIGLDEKSEIIQELLGRRAIKSA